MARKDDRVFLVNQETNEVRALSLAEARALQRTPRPGHSTASLWQPLDPYNRAHLILATPGRDRWSVDEWRAALEAADPAAVARFMDRGELVPSDLEEDGDAA